MIRRILYSFVITAMTCAFVACGDDKDAGDGADTTSTDFSAMDATWDADDSAFAADYDSIRVAHERIAAADVADTALKARIDAQNKAIADIEAKRAAAREKREAARAANDQAAYEAARAEADYAAWRAEVERIRAEQTEMEGIMHIGTKTVGGIDINTGNKDKPLVRVEPGKEDDKPLIRIEPGKDDDKPLIGKNKNP